MVIKSSKIDITRFKTIHNLGKTPLSIRTDLDVKSITILKGYKGFYKIVSQIKKKNQKNLILEYRLYFNFVCHKIDDLIVLIEDNNQKLYMNKHQPTFLFRTFTNECVRTKNEDNYYQKNLENHEIKAKILVKNNRLIKIKSKIFNKKMAYSEFLEKYFISKIVIDIENKTFLEIYTSEYMDKNL